ncbi:MAG: DEAD/DEAH box helicase [Haloferacaceae archaeon]
MRVADLPLPAAVRDHLADRGIEELYPPQAAAVEAGVCEGDRLVVAVPTASGKTLVAQLALLSADGPGLYIVPLRALAREKYEEFAALPGVDVGISTGDLADPESELTGNDVVVATSEKVDSAVRNGAPWVEDPACVVVDEVHLLGAEDRGPTLEVTLATLRRRTPDVQVVGLSATVANPDEIADWLDADLVADDWRPVDLRVGVHADEAVRFDDGAVRSVPTTDPGPDGDEATEATAALVRDVVEPSSTDGSPDEATEGGGALAFVRSRREAEALAERLRAEGLGGAADVAADALDAGATATGERLAACLRDGVAFHHAGLRSTHRRMVEAAFRDRRIAAVCATPTLAAGVNVPARRVVVRDQKRFDGDGMRWLPVLEVHQMCGRAGRPGLDPYGEAVLVAGDADPDDLRERYVGADPEAVESQLADRAALRTHVLSTLAAGFAASRDDLLTLFDATFYAHGAPVDDLAATLDDALADLAEMEMVDRSEGLAATPVGAQVSRQYLSPEGGARVVAGLRRMAETETESTPLTALELVCHTPDMRTGWLSGGERADVYRFAREHADEFAREMGDVAEFEAWLTAVRTAQLLAALADGAEADEVVEAFGVGPGDLESRVERATWLLGAAESLAAHLGLDLPVLDATRERL